MSFESVSLGELSASIDYGLTASANNDPSGPKFLRITDIQDDRVEWSTVPYCTASEREAEANQLKPGDIVFARTGATTGKSYLIRQCPERAVFASYLIRVRPGPRLDPVFLSHYFQSPEYWNQIRANARGAAQPGINSTVLRTLKIPLPPLDEQRRIAAILDQADALRRNTEIALRRTGEFGNVLFREWFGSLAAPRFGNTSVGDVVTDIYRYPTYYDITYVDSGVAEIRGELIKSDGTIELDETKFRYISTATSSQFPKTKLLAGDLVMSVRGTIGKLALVPLQLEGANITANLIRIAPHREKIVPEFLWYSIRSRETMAALVASSSTTTISTIRAPELRALPICFAPRPEQERFAAALKVLQALGRKLEMRLQKARELFSALESACFKQDSVERIKLAAE